MVDKATAEEVGVQKTIRVAIVDDDPFVRTSLSTILSAQHDIEVCAEGANGNEAQDLYARDLPDILLMDIQMPDCSGIEAAEKIIAEHPRAKIVFLTTFSDDEYIVSALRLGAKGYLIKQEVSNIAPALRSVLAGQMVLAGEAIERVDTLMSSLSGQLQKEVSELGRSRALGEGLSEREFEIIELISQGFDNREIAAKVFIGEGTVRNHVSAILQKLCLKNRTQVAVYYYRHLL